MGYREQTIRTRHRRPGFQRRLTDLEETSDWVQQLENTLRAVVQHMDAVSTNGPYRCSESLLLVRRREIHSGVLAINGRCDGRQSSLSPRYSLPLARLHTTHLALVTLLVVLDTIEAGVAEPTAGVGRSDRNTTSLSRRLTL